MQTPNKYDKKPIRPRGADLTLRPRKQEEATHVAEAKGMSKQERIFLSSDRSRAAAELVLKAQSRFVTLECPDRSYYFCQPAVCRQVKPQLFAQDRTSAR